MRPIPLSLLPSTMTWRDPADPSSGVGGSFGPENVTKHVRFEGGAARSSGGFAGDYEVFGQPGGTVWVDAVNSVGGVPRVGALVTVDGSREMTVRSVLPLHTWDGRLHHTELEVS
ncbi:hypothetical protein [uncultured Parolsenella sp.]|uniref:hypothetical protein n=1 Tax=uncultured Parolsenella sp. TaxID=2083008 RepID=UPI0027D9BD9E|nr:hypothetical protein [uncultured Parolsenella sp.]